MVTKNILILEDDLKTLASLMHALYLLEEKVASKLNIDLSITVLADYNQVEDYLNVSKKADFDIILLDRDTKSGGSFHVLDLGKFGVNKIIGISSVPDYNAELREKGVTRIIDKDYNNLEPFALKVCNLIEEMVSNG